MPCALCRNKEEKNLLTVYKCKLGQLRNTKEKYQLCKVLLTKFLLFDKWIFFKIKVNIKQILRLFYDIRNIYICYIYILIVR